MQLIHKYKECKFTSGIHLDIVIGAGGFGGVTVEANGELRGLKLHDEFCGF